jgi:hypothetical protein
LLSLRSFPQREAIHEDTQEAPLAFPVPLKWEPWGENHPEKAFLSSWPTETARLI